MNSSCPRRVSQRGPCGTDVGWDRYLSCRRMVCRPGPCGWMLIPCTRFHVSAGSAVQMSVGTNSFYVTGGSVDRDHAERMLVEMLYLLHGGQNATRYHRQ